MAKTETKNSIALADVISTAIQIPGVKVDRSTFLHEQFKDEAPEQMESILLSGPVEVGIDPKLLRKKAEKLLSERTLMSTGASFLAGIPGGLAMAATIPADVIQFYGTALCLAQELAYLYGEKDFWAGEKPDSEKVTNQLILYCGVMLGATGAAQAVRVLSSSIAKQIAKKLPQKALTKTFLYPIVKSIAKAFSVKMTKEVFAKGISKAVPILGGVVSGGITFATMRPMGMRLLNTLHDAHFDYDQSDFEKDMHVITTEFSEAEENTVTASPASVSEEILRAKKLMDNGVITEEEFAEIKRKLIYS